MSVYFVFLLWLERIFDKEQLPRFPQGEAAKLKARLQVSSTSTTGKRITLRQLLMHTNILENSPKEAPSLPRGSGCRKISA